MVQISAGQISILVKSHCIYSPGIDSSDKKLLSKVIQSIASLKKTIGNTPLLFHPDASLSKWLRVTVRPGLAYVRSPDKRNGKVAKKIITCFSSIKLRKNMVSIENHKINFSKVYKKLKSINLK